MDVASLIVALTGAAALLVSVITSRRGEQQKGEQQAAADELAERDMQWKQRGDVIEDLREENARINTARDRERAEAEKREEVLRGRHEAERTHDRRECVAARAELRDTLSTVLPVIRDEITRASITEALADDAEHDRAVHTD